MRATRAYITSFGTTGLLIASALLMLTVMSAFVAFNGFPGQDVQDPIGTLLVKEHQATVAVPAHPVRRGAAGAKHTRAARDSGAGVSRVHTPVANTSPVDPPATRQPTGTQTPSSTSQPTSGTSPTDSVTQQLSGGTGSLPDPSLPSTDVTLPSTQLPSPSDTQLPLDTSGVTNLLPSP